MHILGINGLGINPSTCLWQDGNLAAFAAEERFTRIKDSFGLMPALATEWCFQKGNIDLQQLDAIAFGWNAPLYRFYMPFFVAKTALQYSSLQNNSKTFKGAIEQLIKYHPTSVHKALRDMFISIGKKSKLPPVFYFPHHLSHAASAYYTSGFERAHIIAMDGSGENQCTTVFEAEGTNIRQIATYIIPHSLGWFYQSITEWLGFTPNSHEGKTMALAAYGNPDATISRTLQKMLKIQPDGSYRHNPVYSFAGKHTSGKIYSDQLEQALGKARAKGETLNTYHHDVAYAAQEMLEHAILGIAENVFKQSGFSGNLCLAGGVALNCKANGVLAEHPAIKNLFVPPVASDDGTALGAALLLAKNKGLNPRISLPHAYWGPAYNDSDIETELRSSGLAYKYVVDIAVYAAQSLAQGKIIGWFQGSMEVGARALGNRSILAHPAISGMKDKVNLEIKNRENWRPFAASILDHAAHRMVQHSKHSPFMTIAFHCTDEAQKLIPEALHVDGTTRPQFVIPEANPLYYHLLTEFEKLTGIAALLNTSFNGHEEPIVCTPQQAINTFKATGLDSLAIGNFWVDKRSEILS